MDASLLTALFSYTGVFYGLIAPLVLLQLLALLLIASLLQSGAQAKSVMKAIVCHVLQALGIILITTGSLLTVSSVLANDPYSGPEYFFLLVLFMAGGLVFLWQDDVLRKMDDASRKVPTALFYGLYSIIGYCIIVYFVLSFVMTLVAGLPDNTDWWVTSVVMILYGGVLIWCTKDPRKPGTSTFFQSMAMHAKVPTMRSIASKTISSRKTSGRR